MNIHEMLSQPDREWRTTTPCSETEIAQLASHSKAQLPTEYIELLRMSNGGEGPVALPPLYFQLYSVKDCIELFHTNQQLLEQFPSFLFFGGNGGLELLAFDLRSGPPWPIVMIDPIAGPESAKKIAPDVVTFVKAIGLESEEQ
jgi:hypothetical protein